VGFNGACRCRCRREGAASSPLDGSPELGIGCMDGLPMSAELNCFISEALGVSASTVVRRREASVAFVVES